MICHLDYFLRQQTAVRAHRSAPTITVYEESSHVNYRTMQIFARTLSGKTLTVDVEPWHTIEVVKERIRDEDGSAPLPMKQVLVYAGMALQNHRTLADYSIVPSDFQLDNACRHVIPAKTKPTTAPPTATVLDLKPATYFDPSDTAHVAAVMDTDHTSDHVLGSFKSKAAESLCATVGVPGAITAGHVDFVADGVSTNSPRWQREFLSLPLGVTVQAAKHLYFDNTAYKLVETKTRGLLPMFGRKSGLKWTMCKQNGHEEQKREEGSDESVATLVYRLASVPDGLAVVLPPYRTGCVCLAPMSATVQEVWQGFHYTVSHIDGARTESAGMTVAALAGLDGKQHWTLDRLVRDGWAARTPHGVIDLGSGFVATVSHVEASDGRKHDDTVDVSLVSPGSVRGWPRFYGHFSHSCLSTPREYTLHMVLRLRGGGRGGFTCADLTSTATRGRTVDFDPSAPWWRGISSGISLGGICHEPSCQAHNQLVYATVCSPGPSDHVATFRMVESTTFPCPACNKSVRPDDKLIVYDCSYNTVGTKATGVSASSGWKDIEGGKPRFFDPRAEDTASATWKVLTFMVRALACVGDEHRCFVCNEHVVDGKTARDGKVRVHSTCGEMLPGLHAGRHCS